jgi:outer membrane protein assembly factor BamB
MAAVSAGQWPQFRGPGASGLDDARPLPTRWDVKTGENVRWRVPVPGLAHSSPIIWDDRIYVTTVTKPGEADLKVGLYGDIASVDEDESHQWCLLAFGKQTGRLLWNTPAFEGRPRVKRHPKSSHCNSSPATDGRRIVALFGSEGLACFDPSGKALWTKDLGPMESGFFAVPSAQWGFASSPILHEGKVIVLCDVLVGSFLAAFDLDSGKELWRSERKDVPTWGTPTVITAAVHQQIVVNGWHSTGGYDPATGRNLWTLDGGGDIPVPTPVFAHGLIYLTSAHGRFRPMRAVRPDATGNITPPDPGQTNAAIVWAHARQGNYMQTPIVVGDSLYGCADSGVLTCFDARTGAIHYSERLSGTGQGFTSSPVSDGRNLYFASELGSVLVVPSGTKFSIVATNELGETCMATPAISDASLFYRTRSRLVAISASR